ncbi:MAG: thioredoxin domain-containing protein [Thermoleophilia bacterium]|nr:thioredoxin domain-containing protein [Thermoleophilia bacterium]
MPSGKRSKLRRREGAGSVALKTPPPVRSKGLEPRRARQASPRALAIGGGVLALIAIGIALAVVLGSGSSSSGIPKGTPTIGTLDGALPGAEEVERLYKGVPQHGLTLGSASAPVRMVMFIDLQCPICRDFEVSNMQTIVDTYVRTGKVRIDLEPWAFIGDDSFRGRLALIAASFQNKAFNFGSVLYDNQGPENSGWLTDGMIAQIAASVPGLNVKRVFDERSSARAKSIARAVDALAAADNVTGTPTVLVGKAGEKPKNVTAPGAAPTLHDVETAIQAALGS